VPADSLSWVRSSADTSSSLSVGRRRWAAHADGSWGGPSPRLRHLVRWSRLSQIPGVPINVLIVLRADLDHRIAEMWQFQTSVLRGAPIFRRVHSTRVSPLWYTIVRPFDRTGVLKFAPVCRMGADMGRQAAKAPVCQWLIPPRAR